MSIGEVSIRISDAICMIFLLPLFHEYMITVLALPDVCGCNVGF